MARITKEVLNELKKQYNTNKVYSWSKLDCFLTDKWIYYLRYIKREKPDNRNGAYAEIGTVVHNQLESFYEDNLTNEQMVNNLLDGYDECMLKGFKFDKFDDKMNKKIADKYIFCCKHFLESHKRAMGSTKCEAFVPLVLQDKDGENKIIQCYIDFLNIDEGILKIIDYKTSTLYSKKKQKELSGQLKIYALAINKTLKVPLEKIKIAWNFLKYVNVEYLQQNGKWKVRHVERNEIGDGLKVPIRSWAKKLKYSEDEIAGIINDCVLSNSINSLPENIKEKFNISDCEVYVDFNEEDTLALANKILETITNIEKLELKYQLSRDEMLYWQDVEKGDEYRLANLCDYSPSLHLPYGVYLESKKNNFTLDKKTLSDKELDDLFD